MINRVDMYYLASNTSRLGTKAKKVCKRKRNRQLTRAPTGARADPAAGRQKLLERHGGGSRPFPWERSLTMLSQMTMYGQGCAGKDALEAAKMATPGIAYLPAILVNRQTRHFLQAALRPLKKCMTKEMTATISKR
jgi:hypothetical protein